MWQTPVRGYHMQEDAEAVLIVGAYLTGKSSVAAEIADILEDRGVFYALLDLDYLGWADAPGYDGHGVYYVEFGSQGVATVDVTFVAGQAPFGFIAGPSVELTAEKARFGTTRVARWFGHDW